MTEFVSWPDDQRVIKWGVCPYVSS
jgi:hypothetical protein